MDLYASLFVFLIFLSIIILNYTFLNQGVQEIILEISTALLITSGVYIFLRKKFGNIEKTEIKFSNKKFIILNILFFLTIIIINCIFYYSLYRPQIYYLLIVFCGALIGYDILVFQDKSSQYLTLFKIFICGFILRADLFYQYPSLFGKDTWGHAYWVRLIQEIGYLPNNLIENVNYPPAYHLEALTTLLLTNLNIKDSIFFSNGLMYTIGIIFIFLFVRILFGNEIALLSAFLAAINQFHIVWGAWIIPTSMGVMIFSVLLYLILKQGNRKEITIIFILFSVLLMYLHTLSPLIICIAIYLYIIFYFISKIITNKAYFNFDCAFSSVLITIPTVLFIIRYLFFEYKDGYTFFECVLYPLKKTIISDATSFSGEITTYTASSFPLNRVSFLLIISFTLFGGYLFLKRNLQSRERLGLICTFSALIIIAYAPTFFNIDNFIPGRWIIFGMILALPICAFSIFYIINIPNNKKFRITGLLLIIMIITFFCINTQSVNLHTPFYEELSKDPHRPSAYTSGEMKAADTLISIFPGSIQSTYPLAFNYYISDKYGALYYADPPITKDLINTIILTRKYDQSHPDIFYDQYYSNPMIIDTNYSLHTDKINLIYNNQIAWATYSP